MEKTWMPMVAGILILVSAGSKLLALLGIMIASFVAILPVSIIGVTPLVLLLLIAIPLAIVTILAVVGGIYALQRKKWGLALAGSIVAFLPFSLLGLAAVILVALSRDEFE